jgi:hypothetical protein
MRVSKSAAKGAKANSGAPKFKDMRYPNVAFTEDTDYVQISFFNYIAPFGKDGGSADQNLAGYNKSSDSLGTATSTINMYMPQDMEGQYGGNWENQNIANAAKAALGLFGKSAGGKGLEGLADSFDLIKEMSSNSLTKGTTAANLVSAALGAANFGSVSVNDIFSVTTGQVLNPNTEVLYNGPKMRTFALDFKMAPRNQSECDKIRQIIETFKYATLPNYGGAGDENASFVQIPQLVDVTFMTGNKPNEWVTQYKPAVITDFNVSYTPDGAWATLPNGAPVATQITIQFNETKMVYGNEVWSEKPGATY